MSASDYNAKLSQLYDELKFKEFICEILEAEMPRKNDKSEAYPPSLHSIKYFIIAAAMKSRIYLCEPPFSEKEKRESIVNDIKNARCDIKDAKGYLSKCREVKEVQAHEYKESNIVKLEGFISELKKKIEKTIQELGLEIE